MTHYEEYAKAEVVWYRANGQHQQERIARSGSGIEYVIGDDSWNDRNVQRPEFIERQMLARLKGLGYE